MNKSFPLVGRIDSEYRERMYGLLDLDLKKGNSSMLLQSTKGQKSSIQITESLYRKNYVHLKSMIMSILKGKANIFIAIDPQRGKRKTKVTLRRTKRDFVYSLKDIIDAYPKARKLHLVMDNLNTHFPKSIIETFGESEGQKMLSRLEFHYTPKHASWLNMAEIEINVMDTECTGRRFDSKDDLEKSVKAWEWRRKRKKCRIKWTFTKEKADRKLSNIIQNN